MSPTEYRPRRPEDFIGPAKELACLLAQKAAHCVRSGEPIKILIRGEPGIGKSALLDPFLEQLGANRWTITKWNGTQVKIENLEEWAGRLAYRELFGTYRVLRIEEVDKASYQAQVRMLTLLDELPRNTAIVCTSNKEVKDFEPRFQSRFQVFTLQAPDGDQIKWLLKKFGLRRDDINRIATFACGNVRLALFDAQSALDELSAKGGAL